MQYLNIPASVLDSVEFVGSEPVDQATWLKIQRYCIGQENSGIIPRCKNWKDRKCQQLLRITRVEMLRECDLWEWEGDDLHVHFYPAEQEAIVAQKRQAGALGGRVKSEAKAKAARVNGQSGGRNKTQAETQAEAKQTENENPTERKGKEGKEKEERESAREEDPLAGMARRIVDAYPRRERVADALGIVLGHLKAGEPAERMLSGTHAAALAIAQAPSGALNRFIPSAVSYFSGKRWQDDPATLFRAPEKNGGKGALTETELGLQLGPRGNTKEFGY